MPSLSSLFLSSSLVSLLPICLLSSVSDLVRIQFYNVSTNCLEASAEILHFNQDTSASGFVYFYGKKDDTGKGKDDGDGEDKPRVKTGKPLVEHVAFSRDGKARHA